MSAEPDRHECPWCFGTRRHAADCQPPERFNELPSDDPTNHPTPRQCADLPGGGRQVQRENTLPAEVPGWTLVLPDVSDCPRCGKDSCPGCEVA